MTRVFCLLCAVLFIGCGPAISPPVSSPRVATVEIPVYSGDVAINPVSRQLSARWSIQFAADSATVDSAVFLLNRGLAVSRVAGAGVAGFASQRDEDQVVIVRFSPRLVLGAQQRIDIDYSGVPVFGSDSINRITPTWVELGLDSYWLPVFAGYRKRIAGEVHLDLPRGWNGVASGNIARSGNRLLLTVEIPLIDIAFSASPTLSHTDAATASVFWTRPDPPTVARVLETAESCRHYLNMRYGAADSLLSVRLVLAPRSGPGYARRNYIVLTDAASIPASALGGYICHEFAHYWSSAANSSGPENWLNEGMAEYVSSRYVRATFGAAPYDSTVARWEKMSVGQPPIWTPQSMKRPSAQVAYRKAPFLLSRLEERIGAEKMERFLQRYMVERIRKTPQLVAALEDVAGAEAAAWFRAELGR